MRVNKDKSRIHWNPKDKEDVAAAKKALADLLKRGYRKNWPPKLSQFSDQCVLEDRITENFRNGESLDVHLEDLSKLVAITLEARGRWWEVTLTSHAPPWPYHGHVFTCEATKPVLALKRAVKKWTAAGRPL